MIEFGKTLRESREARGFTVAQLAEATKLMPSTIADLENEDFSRIAAPIYGRGFVKLYCDAVGIDAKPLITEFMEMLEGNREPVIRERPAAAVHEKAPEPEPEEPAAEPGPPPLPASAVPAVDRQDAFRLEAETRTIPVGGGEPPAGDPFAPP
ncbi:MAG: helix-turn-helix domain-containing protein, partial [Kiritimatiellae bacterium]|nr:helix-turn-helix domain-containing protein [Kiritimatiellia bacterium]